MRFNPKPFENRLKLYLARQEKKIEDMINASVNDIVRRTTLVNAPSDRDFFFRDYPALSKTVDNILKRLSLDLTGLVQSGIEWSWDLANTKNDNMVSRLLRSIGKDRVPADAVERWNQKNLPALEAFEKRRIGGMGLSDKVWAYSKGIKGDMELALDLGIGEGMSAARLSRSVRQYLNEPDRLYRRVRDEKGVLRLSKSASNYHPGPGVYRSSYKNAKRLATTETNMAYRRADCDRAQQLDFILGIEIHLSKNHTCLNSKGVPVPFHDICDELQGRYPKDFVFTGWHPNCRCYMTTILPNQDEFIKYVAAMDENGHSDYQLTGAITELPSGYTDWIEDNKERIQQAEERGKLPYFLKDNPQTWEDAVHKPSIDDDVAKALETELGVKKGKPMSYEDADTGRENPNYNVNKIDEWRNNCQSCTMVHELRRRGFDIEVAPNARKLFSTFDWQDRFLNEDGSKAKREWSNVWAWGKGYKKMSDLRVAEFFTETMSAPGRYEIYVKWSGANSAHVFLAEVGADKIPRFFDPQSGKDNYTFLSRIEKKKIGVLRIDDKKINPKCVSVFLPKGSK